MSVDKTNDRVREMFGEIAPKYDRMNHLLSMQVDRYWRWRTVRMVPPGDEALVLDICTGTGDLAFAYWKAGRGRVKVIGADFCPQMLDIAEQKKRQRAIDGQVSFVEADTQDLPFEDEKFQIVSVAFGLRNVADTDRGLAEMARVCAPGGRVVVLEFSMPQWQPMKAIYGWYFHHILPRFGQLLARNSHTAYSYLPESVGEFPQGQALVERMQAVGLESVRYSSLTFGIATLYVGRKREGKSDLPASKN